MSGYSISQVAERTGFAPSALRFHEQHLNGHTPDGPCDRSCGCVAEAEAAGVAVGSNPASAVPIACTLASDELGARLAEWRTLAGTAVGRQRLAGGVQLEFPRTVDLAAVATLIAAEQECCRFLTFTMTVADDHVLLTIAAPRDAMSYVDELVGCES